MKTPASNVDDIDVNSGQLQSHAAAGPKATMFPTLLRRAAQQSRSQLDLPNVAFKLKKVWPPDFTKLSPQEQLRLEKKYKRRAQLATARPTWNKAIRLAQLFTIGCTSSAPTKFNCAVA